MVHSSQLCCGVAAVVDFADEETEVREVKVPPRERQSSKVLTSQERPARGPYSPMGQLPRCGTNPFPFGRGKVGECAWSRAGSRAPKNGKDLEVAAVLPCPPSRPLQSVFLKVTKGCTGTPEVGHTPPLPKALQSSHLQVGSEPKSFP